MKKILFFVPGAVFFFLVSCNNATTTSSEATATNTQADKNLAAFRTVVEAFQTGDISKIDSVVAPDFVDHTDRGEQGRDSLKAMITMVHTTDMKSQVVKELADDEWVYGLMRYTGTSKGEMGPPGPYDFTTMEVVKFKDGKAVEHWAYMEPREMMKMYAPPKDATKKK